MSKSKSVRLSVEVHAMLVQLMKDEPYLADFSSAIHYLFTVRSRNTHNLQHLVHKPSPLVAESATEGSKAAVFQDSTLSSPTDAGSPPSKSAAQLALESTF